MADGDERPVFAIGHMSMDVDDVGEAYAFFAKYGMRGILERPAFAILELRGGTHLILSQAETSVEPGQRAPFDLMVDDVDAVHARFVADGVAATAIEARQHPRLVLGDRTVGVHDSFQLVARRRGRLNGGTPV